MGNFFTAAASTSINNNHKQLRSEDDDFVVLPRRIVLIFDLDGTLADRMFLRKHTPFAPSTVINGRYKLYPRPGVKKLLDFCMNHRNLDVAVWGNIVPWNLEPIAKFLFPEQSATRKYSDLRFVWSRDQCDRAGRKNLTTLKQLAELSPRDVLIVDDNPATIQDDLMPNAILVPRYRVTEQQQQDDTMERLLDALQKLDFETKDARELAIMVNKKLQ
jgi:hypothetical protein